MGLWNFVKAFWDPDAKIDNTIFAQRVAFYGAKSKWPDRDPNAWLAFTLSTRPGWRGRPEEVYYYSTALFSMLPEDNALKAMAMWILSKEDPALAERCGAEFEYLTAPVLGLIETGELEGMWRRVNPWTAALYPHIGYGIGRASTPEGLAEYDADMRREEK